MGGVSEEGRALPRGVREGVEGGRARAPRGVRAALRASETAGGRGVPRRVAHAPAQGVECEGRRRRGGGETGRSAAMRGCKEAAELKFPASRIRKMMLADDEVGKIGQTTPILISKALELFIGALAKEAAEKTKERDAKTVSIGDLKAVVDAVEDYDFLRDVVADFAEGGDEPEDAHAGDDEGEGEQ